MAADLILVLDNGRIVQRGIHQELLNQPGKYQEIFELQTTIDEALQKELAQTGDATS
jgi:ATP-binding cassette subfamily B protein